MIPLRECKIVPWRLDVDADQQETLEVRQRAAMGVAKDKVFSKIPMSAFARTDCVYRISSTGRTWLVSTRASKQLFPLFFSGCRRVATEYMRKRADEDVTSGSA